MKEKWIAVFLGALVLAGCGNAAAGSSASFAVSAGESSSAAESSSAWSSEASEPKAPEMELIGAGDTIKTESCEVKVNSVSFSYDVLPENKSTFYTHYPADKGKVYIDVDVDVKNLQKQALPCDEVMEVDADYNDGYVYSGMAVVEDATGFTYSNITAIDPLETKAMRYLVNCPQEVEETDYPLFLVLQIDGQSYKYVMRGEGVQAPAAVKSSENPNVSAVSLESFVTTFNRFMEAMEFPEEYWLRKIELKQGEADDTFEYHLSDSDILTGKVNKTGELVFLQYNFYDAADDPDEENLNSIFVVNGIVVAVIGEGMEIEDALQKTSVVLDPLGLGDVDREILRQYVAGTKLICEMEGWEYTQQMDPKTSIATFTATKK